MCAFVQNPPTVGLKWTAADGSSPLAIVLSNHSPEIAANNANKTTALDCGRAEIFQEWVQATTNPSVSQQSKQVGSGKEPSQVEYTQTQETIEDESGARSVRETQQTHVRTDDGASVTLRRGMEDRACAALGCADDKEPLQVEYTQTQETIEERGASSVRETHQTHVCASVNGEVLIRNVHRKLTSSKKVVSLATMDEDTRSSSPMPRDVSRGTGSQIDLNGAKGEAGGTSKFMREMSPKEDSAGESSASAGAGSGEQSVVKRKRSGTREHPRPAQDHEEEVTAGVNGAAGVGEGGKDGAQDVEDPQQKQLAVDKDSYPPAALW